jgi:hypothetical protein
MFPTKILQQKNSQSPNSSQCFSTKIVSNFLQKEFIDSPAKRPESNRVKAKKKTKQKSQGQERMEKEEKQDFITWKQICEDARNNTDMQNIDNEDKPNLSDITGLSSLDEENLSVDAYMPNGKILINGVKSDFNSLEGVINKSEVKLLNSENIRITNIARKDSSSDLTLDQIYFMSNPDRLESLSNNIKNSSCTVNIDVKNNSGNYDSDDGMSTSSTKTFRKSDCSNKEMNFVDSLELPKIKPQNDILKCTEEDQANIVVEKMHMSRDCQTRDDEFVDKKKKILMSGSSSPAKRSKDQFPIKCISLPNILNRDVKESPRMLRSNDKSINYATVSTDKSSIHDCETIIGNHPLNFINHKFVEKKLHKLNDSGSIYNFFFNNISQDLKLKIFCFCLHFTGN